MPSVNARRASWSARARGRRRRQLAELGEDLLELGAVLGAELAERRAGRELGSATAVADSRQTLICTYLSAAVLIGLLLNTGLGWWWADAIAGLVIAGFAVREGREAWRGDACATSVGMLLEDEPDDHAAH